jgi:pyruvate ferredoxin oxidoreductase delta subunit
LAKSEGELTWKDLEPGSIVIEPGNASQYQTGAWRSQRQTVNFKRCIKCGICYIFCPEGCITQNAEGYFEANPFYCKGCGICACECPTEAITMVEEE